MLDPLEEGISLFNERRYFEAHEEFEILWRASSGDLRLLYQGFVQACAGLVKHQRGQNESAVTLLRKGLAKLEATPSSCRPGIDVDLLAGDLRRAIAALRAHQPFDPPEMRRPGDV